MTEDVPGYRVLRQVGEGGFSVVYLAYQERLDRQVALKVLSVNTIDQASMQRFQRECKITGRLTGHPNVVTVLDTGTTRAGRPYIAMEYFEHGSLDDRLQREGPLPVADVLRVGVKLAGALAATHETDVLHRDVKPQNILVSRYGEPALADFGVARLVDSFDSTHTNAFTPHHAAPEILEGKAPGATSDIYSLGSTLYQLLAGRPAFKGPHGEGLATLIVRILGDPPPPITRGDLPRPVFDAIATAMAKEPGHRFPNAVAFAQRLQQVQHELGLPITELPFSGTSDPSATGPGTTGPAVTGPGLTGPGMTGPGRTGPRPESGGTGPGIPAPRPATPDPWSPALPGPEAFVSSPVSPEPAWHPAAAVAAAGPSPVDAMVAEARTQSYTPHAPHAPQQPAPRPQVAAPHAAHPVHPVHPIHPGHPVHPATAPPVGTEPAAVTVPPAASSGGPNRGLLVAGTVAIAGGLVLGVVGIVVFTGGSQQAGPAATGSTPTSQDTQSTQGGTGPQSGEPAGPPQLTPTQIRAAAPRNLQVVQVGGTARLNWALPPSARRLPVIVKRSPAGSQPIVSAGTGTVTTTIARLQPRTRHCFRIGALLAPGNPPVIAWSAIRCITTR